MANKKTDPTESEKEEATEAPQEASSEQQLAAIFNAMDGRKIKSILASGTAILQERMAAAIDKVLTAHLAAFEERSFIKRGIHSLLSIIVISAKGVTWDDATTFLRTAAPVLTKGGILPVVRLRDEGDEAKDQKAPVLMELEVILPPGRGEHNKLFDFLDESGVSLKEALEYLQSSRANSGGAEESSDD